MRTIINYIRSLFCEHDFELLANVTVKDIGLDTVSYHQTYRCCKCGFVQRVRL